MQLHLFDPIILQCTKKLLEIILNGCWHKKYRQTNNKYNNKRENNQKCDCMGLDQSSSCIHCKKLQPFDSQVHSHYVSRLGENHDIFLLITFQINIFFLLPSCLLSWWTRGHFIFAQLYPYLHFNQTFFLPTCKMRKVEVYGKEFIRNRFGL